VFHKHESALLVLFPGAWTITLESSNELKLISTYLRLLGAGLNEASEVFLFNWLLLRAASSDYSSTLQYVTPAVSPSS
jgi:hypothetical protein